MSSQARTHRVQRMHVDMSCWMIGSPSRSSPDRRGSPERRVVGTSYRRTSDSNSLRAPCGGMSSAGYRSSNIESTPWRLLIAAFDSVCTRMPSEAAVAHEATSFDWPSTCTRQIRQLPTTGSFGYQHKVGTSIASARAASRMVDPSGTETVRPSMVSVGMMTGSSKRAVDDFWSIYRVREAGDGDGGRQRSARRALWCVQLRRKADVWRSKPGNNHR